MNVLAQRTSPYSNSNNLTESPGMVIDQIGEPGKVDEKGCERPNVPAHEC